VNELETEPNGQAKKSTSYRENEMRPWGLMAEEIRKLNGFPVKTRFALGLGGRIAVALRSLTAAHPACLHPAHWRVRW